jgi:hypothetical protein
MKIIPKFWGIHAGIQRVALNFIILIIISLLTKPLENEHM